jgi:hypothetical protein
MVRTGLAVSLLVLVLAGTVSADGLALEIGIPELTQCAPANLTAQITNDTTFPVLLERIAVPAAGATHDWTHQVYGSVTYDEGSNTFRHDRMAQQAAPLRSAQALLPPGGRLQCAMPVTLPEPGQVEVVVSVSYHVISSDDLARCLYLPGEVTDARAVYKPAGLETLKAFAGSRPLSADLATRELPEPSTAEVKVTLTVREPALPLEQALSRVAVIAQQYDTARERWLFETRTGILVVGREGTEYLPGLDIEAHAFIGSSGDSVSFWLAPESLPEAARAAVGERLARYKPEEAMGLHFEVPAAAVPALASDLARLGLRVTVGDFQLTPALTIRPAER